MPLGPGGKYDAHCEAVLKATHATLVAVLVLSGDHGSGFSVSTFDTAALQALPTLLESMARDVRADLASPGTPIDPQGVN